MNTSRGDNTERNARIIDLARQGKAPAEIARELGVSRGVVSGVIRRARDAGTLTKAQTAQTAGSREPIATQNVGEADSRLGEARNRELGSPVADPAVEPLQDSLQSALDHVRGPLHGQLEVTPPGE